MLRNYVRRELWSKGALAWGVVWLVAAFAIDWLTGLLPVTWTSTVAMCVFAVLFLAVRGASGSRGLALHASFRR